MFHAVCPWWLGPVLASPLRRLAQDPGRILRPFVAEGMVVLEPGPGMGFFTLELARLVGPGGKVVARAEAKSVGSFLMMDALGEACAIASHGALKHTTAEILPRLTERPSEKPGVQP